MSSFNANSWKPSNFPYVRHSEDDLMGGLFAVPGGEVAHFKAGGALNVGDVVVYSAALTVNKTTTVGDHDMIAGVVVGGARTFFEALSRKEDYNVIQAAASGEEVMVLYNGFAFCIFDAAVSAIGDYLIPSTTTAGRVKSGTTAGLILGKLVDAASSGSAADLKLCRIIC